MGLPIHVYPLYENAFRAHRGQSIQENNRESAKLYADFAAVAEKNSLAWNYGKAAATEKDIGIVSKRNRMICFPCKWLLGVEDAFNVCRPSSDERFQHRQFGGRMSAHFD